MKSPIPAYVFGIAIVLATFASGCAENGPNPALPSAPQAPTPPPPPPAPTTYTLSGIVFEATTAGNVPLEAVEVYCDSCGWPDGHSQRMTDAKGAYSFDGVIAGTHAMLVSKQGYVLPGQPDQSGSDGLGWVGTVMPVVAGDTRYDIVLARK